MATRPLNLKKLAEIIAADKEKTENALEELRQDYKERGGGIQILKNGNVYQMATAPDCAKLVEEFVRKEETGELTRPQLETLTVILYRGPVGKPELDQIRGVNSALILRNLLIRGLIEAQEDKKTDSISYAVTMDFFKFLGIRDASELPGYEKLNGSKALAELLNRIKKDGEAAPGGEAR